VRLALVVLAGCRIGFDPTSGATALDVHVAAPAGLTIAQADARIAFSTIDPNALTPITDEHLFTLPDVDGALACTIDATDDTGRLLSATAMVTIAAKTTQSLTIDLTGTWPATCFDGAKDGNETDVDCGGGQCPGCALGSACAIATDCATASCSASTCEQASGPPGWISATSMPSVRYGFAMAVGGDHRVYVFGGGMNTGTPSPDTIAYDFDAGTWSPTGALVTPRIRVSGAADGSGSLYALGGDIAGTAQTAVDMLVPGGAWTSATALPTGVDFAAAATSSTGNVYLFGGWNGTVSTAIVYELAGGWVTRASLPMTRQNLATATVGSRIVATGGHDVGNVVWYGDTFAYDTTLDTWVTLASMNHPRSDLCAATGADGRMYTFGGYNTGIALAFAEALRLPASHWVDVPSIAIQSDSCAATTLPDGRMMVAGGRDTNANANTNVQIYGPKLTVAASDVLTVTGANFGANAAVRIYIDDVPVELALTNATGAFTATLPALTGAHTVRAIDAHALYPVTASLGP
jgi:hypothetical protein